MTRLVLDPVTRIGGLLRLELALEGSTVADAWSSGSVFRGVEPIMVGRDPRDAWLFAQRVCGSCGSAHALGAVRAVERALELTIPRNARLIRNILVGSRHAQDHAINFYRGEALDWVDVEEAIRATPEATAAYARRVSPWPNHGVAYFEKARDRLAAVLASGQLGPFANGYWGHPAYTLAAEPSLMLMAHYIEALDWRRRVTRIQTLLGGKNPHPQTFLVGGMAAVPPWGGPNRPLPGEHPVVPDKQMPAALGAEGLDELTALATEVRAFVEQAYLPDVMVLVDHYRDWVGLGVGLGNYLSFGEYPEDDGAPARRLLPAGRIIGGSWVEVSGVDQAGVGETVVSSHYEGDGEDPVHPFDETTVPRYGGPRPPVTTLEGSTKYSWIKAARYTGDSMEVGPLARMLVGYVQGSEQVQEAVNTALSSLGAGQELFAGTLGRVLARALEAKVLARRIEPWLRALEENMASGDLAVADITAWDPSAWPREAEGWSLGEGSKGSIGHWVTIRDSKIATYQIVDAGTWNASPRDARGFRGPLEAALVRTPVVDAQRPVEILRTLHSFDLCASCAAHVYDPRGAGRSVARSRRHPA